MGYEAYRVYIIANFVTPSVPNPKRVYFLLKEVQKLTFLGLGPAIAQLVELEGSLQSGAKNEELLLFLLKITKVLKSS